MPRVPQVAFAHWTFSINFNEHELREFIFAACGASVLILQRFYIETSFLPLRAGLSSQSIFLEDLSPCQRVSIHIVLEMCFPLAYVTVVAVYYLRRVICDDQCFNIGQVQVGIDSTGADYLPCEPAASTSSCCPLGWICLSNGLCEPLPGNTTQNLGLTSLYTGFCTDPLWRNETICPKVCNNNVTRMCPLGDYSVNTISSSGA